LFGLEILRLGFKRHLSYFTFHHPKKVAQPLIRVKKISWKLFTKGIKRSANLCLLKGAKLLHHEDQKNAFAKIFKSLKIRFLVKLFSSFAELKSWAPFRNQHSITELLTPIAIFFNNFV
jgi:hypothetical protein